MSSKAPRQLRASEPAGPLHAPAADVDTGLAQSAGSAMPAWSDSPRQLKQSAQLTQLQAAASATPAQGGLPQGLRQGIESMSGLDMSGVRVHRNSSKPAALQAHAYAQGQDIHLGPGQEKHLPHEAWHVVQQAQGRVRPTVQMAGGVAVNDDGGLEREADVMGARAMQPRSNQAKDLISSSQGKYTEGQFMRDCGSAAVIQAKGGNVAAAKVLPRFHNSADARPTVLEALPVEEQHRDADHNDANKVAFENALATWVVGKQAALIGPIKQLSAKLDEYLRLREDHINKTVASSLARLAPDASTYGRLAGQGAYPDQLRALLADGDGTMHEHLLVQQSFVDKIYNQDVTSDLAILQDQFSDLISDPLLKDALKPADGPVDVGVGTMTYDVAHNNARTQPRGGQARRVQQGGLGPYDAQTHGQGEMERGTDKFTAVESNAFVQSARLLFNMPVSGTGLSGSATDLFTCATLFGRASAPDREKFALAAFSFFAHAGAHTFHEVMVMARATGFNQYEPGAYITAIPDDMRAGVRQDLNQYAALLNAPAAVVVAPQAQDSRLHGWKDELALDGEPDGWAAKVQAFLATRFNVANDAVAVEPITDGRSGDAVFKIVVTRAQGQPFRGIFKVFNDADMADTEIDIAERMTDKGVRTPGNHGLARVETDDGPSKSGVLLDFAEGESPHTLVKQIGGLPVDSDRRPPLIQTLTRGVIAVAKELAKLHGKTGDQGQQGRIKGPKKLRREDVMNASVKTVHEKGLYEIHLQRAVAQNKVNEQERQNIVTAFDALVTDKLVQQKLRKSMTHGDANAANFLVDGDDATVIDVNTASQSLGPSGELKTGASDTGRFLETLRTSAPGALSDPELATLETEFHKAYMPSTAQRALADTSRGENDLLDALDKERLADLQAEEYYRACWILNQVSHATDDAKLRWSKQRLIALVPALNNQLEIPPP